MTDTMSLATLAGIDMEGIEEVRFEALPKSQLHLKCEGAELVDGETADGDPYARINVSCVIVECLNVLDPKWRGDAESLVGKSYTEGFYIPLKVGTDESSADKDRKKTKDAIGRFKAFFTDCGSPDIEDASLQGLVDALADHEFGVIMGTRADKNDPDKIYNQFSKVGPLI